MPATEETSLRKRRPSSKRAAPAATTSARLRALPSLPPFVVRRSTIQGRGVFATRDIAKEELIIEYIGRKMTHEEVGVDDEAVRRHHTFLFSVDDELCIDGAVDGNEARFINHSCTPNAYAEIEKRRIFIRALRPIPAGDEIVYDYWYSTDPAYDLEDLKRLYPCRCGTAKCRGTLAAPPKKPRAKKAKARKTARNGSRR
jgi:SET domain-containing protein